MPRAFMFTKEEIISAAVELTREKGFSALTARALGERLGSSSKPIFGLFESMAEIKNEVLNAANSIYLGYLKHGAESGEYPPYKASGMAYIRFAGEERELFKLLYMRDRSGEAIGEDRTSILPLLELIEKNLGVDEDTAYRFHMEMWIYVHGIATMIATGFLRWDDAWIDKILTDAYTGLKYSYSEGCRHAGDQNG